MIPFAYPSSDYIIRQMTTAAGYHSLDNLQHMVRTSIMMQIFLDSSTAGCLLSRESAAATVRAAAHHDIGKIYIPDELLLKQGKLTDAEFKIIQSHPDKGAEYLKRFAGKMEPALWRVMLQVCRYHHERWDGSGYPQGLSGEDIPLPARLMALVDVYDALTHDRPYRPALSQAEAMQIIKDGKGSHFDPALTEQFLQIEDLLVNEPDIMKSHSFKRH